MRTYSLEVQNFIKEKILPQMGLKEMNDENISNIVDYMAQNIEDPLCNDEESGIKLTEEEKETLRLATKAITEITSDPKW